MNEKHRRAAARSAILAGVLLLATLAIGATARHRQSGSVPPGSQTLTFAATGGGPVSFRGRLDTGAVLRGGDGLARIELLLGAERDSTLEPTEIPTDLIVILDRSGSMQGEKIVHARAAIRELIAQLGARDRFGLVTYATGSRLAIPLHEAGAMQRESWLARVARITPDGGTNLSSGLDLAHATVERHRVPGRALRVVVISDGLANQGDHSISGLRARAGRAVAGEYVLSTVGVGTDFDEQVLTQLADAGTGNYYYVSDVESLTAVFSDEFLSARETVARGLEVRIQPGEGVAVLDAAGYPLERRGGSVVFRPGALFSGQERRIWVTLRTPTHEVGEFELARFSLSYSDGDGRRELAFEKTPRLACVADQETFAAAVDKPTWERGLVVDAYNAMRERVADSVKAGERGEALGEIERYRLRALSYGIQSPAVAAQITESEGLEQRVEDAFAAPEPAREQNALSKSLGAQARDERRVGGKR